MSFLTHPLPRPKVLVPAAALVSIGLFTFVLWPKSDWPSSGSQEESEGPPESGFLVHPYLQLPTPTSMTVMWETAQKLPGRVEFGLTSQLDRAVEIDKRTVLHEVALTDLEPGTTYYYRVKSGDLESETAHFKTAPTPGTRRWRMAVYGDSRSNPPGHRKVVEQIVKANVDLIVHTGDIVLNGKNHDSWRKEFFGPIEPLGRSVPWVSTIGNHENDSENYFSYMALPGNERYFGFDYGNAHIICLDSNAWIAKGRDSKQFQWLTAHLKEKRSATWTFVVFHHPLFSAHDTRPINMLRWDWAPVFLDQDNGVDGVLTGHDHFYARNFLMGRLDSEPRPGVLFLTSAGGGASLYRTKPRDYVARERAAHHFTLFDFDGDQVTLSAIDVTGVIFDRWVWKKQPTPPSEFCAFEVEELKQFLRLALTSARSVPLAGQGPTVIDTSLQVPTRFKVPVSGQMRWQEIPGWKLKHTTVDFQLQPGQPLVIPLHAEVAAGPLVGSPRLTVAFAGGKFLNRLIEVYPFKLGGPETLLVKDAKPPLRIDGKLAKENWQGVDGHTLLGLPPRGGRGDWVGFQRDSDWLYVGARLDDPEDKIKVKPLEGKTEPSRLVLFGEHIRVALWDGKKTRSFAFSPDQVGYTDLTNEEATIPWRGAAARQGGAWTVEMAIPRKLFADLSKVRVNVVHHRRDSKGFGDLELCPTYGLGPNPDLIPDWKPAEKTDQFARLVVK